MKQVKYFSRPGGSGSCLWRVDKRGNITVYGRGTNKWWLSLAKPEELTWPKFVKVSRDKARKWFPDAFRKPFNTFDFNTLDY